MSETTNATSTGQTETPENKIQWFYWISADFTQKRDQPKREYFENGYREITHETGVGFMGRTIELPADESVTRIGFLNYAIDQILETQNESRRARGETIMFDRSSVMVKAFDCGRNEL